MLSLSYLLRLLLAALATAVSLAMPASIGKTSSSIEARGVNYPSAAGRLFNIDGNKEYFSGKLIRGKVVETAAF